MGRVRVPVANTAGKSVRINSDATAGATIGTDLRLPDGSVPTMTELATALALGSVAAQPARSDAYIYWNQILGDYDFIQFDITYADGSAEGKLSWNVEDGTLQVGMPGGNVNLQIGQEQLVRCRNTTGVQIDNGSVVYIVGASGNKPLIALADASVHSTAHVLGFATENIADNANGYVTIAGLVRDVDTDGMAVGGELWLSETAGEYTETEPVFPATKTHVAHVIAAHATEGVILAMIHDTKVETTLGDFDTDLDAIMEMNIGVALDPPDVSVSSNGTVITFTMEKTGTGDIRFMFSDGVHTHDCTDPIASIALNVGTDTSPQINYVYILQSNKTLTVSTAGWPSAEHAPLATVLCQSAASSQTDGVYKMHAWTDHNWNEETGHIAHLNFWIRSQSATWRSGVLCTPTVGAATFDLAIATGSILQLHPHTMPAFDTSTGSEVMIPNQNGTAYDRVGNMVSQITDANGVSMSGKYYNLVVWGVVSEDTADCQIMVNLPTDSYVTSAGAVADADATTVYDIPSDFLGTGFLIARLICRHQVGGNTYSIVSNVDLRGKQPSVSVGGTVGGGVAALSDLSDADAAGFTNNDLMYWSGGVLIDTAGALTFDGTDLVCGGDVQGLTVGIEDKGEIDHTGSTLRIKGLVTSGAVAITALNAVDAAKSILYGDPDGAAGIYYAGTVKLQTAAGGITVSGDVSATSYGGIAKANLVSKIAAETIVAQWTFDVNPEVDNTSPAYRWVDNDGATDETRFTIRYQGGQVRFQNRTDLDAGPVNWFTMDRTGMVTDDITLTATAIQLVGAVTGTSFGGIAEANLISRAGNEAISGLWRFAVDTYFGAASGTAVTNVFISAAHGMAIRSGTGAGGWARGFVPVKHSDSSRIGGAGWLGSGETLTSFNVGFSPSWWGGNDRVEFTAIAMTLQSDVALIAKSYIQLQRVTTANLADVTHAINTSNGKVDGAMVWNLTTNMPVFANGSADADVWFDAAANIVHTPI